MKFKPKKVLTWLVKGVGYLLAFVALIVTVALIGLQTPWAQHKIARVIAKQADASLEGRVEVTLDGSLSLFGFTALSVRILPSDINDNRPLAELTNVQASWDLKALIGSLLGSGPLYVGINHVECERVFVDLRPDPDGNLALVNATKPVPSTEPEPPSTGPSPYIHLKGLDIFDVHVLLPADSAQPETEAERREATIAQIHADFDMQDAMSGTVSLTSLQAAIPGQQSAFLGNVGAAFYLDEDAVPVAKASVEGDLGGVPITVDGIYDDKRWVAQVGADGTAAAWREAVQGFEPTEPIELSVLAIGDLESADVNADISAGLSAISTSADITFSPFVGNGNMLAQRVNPRAFAAAAPQGDINVRAGFSAKNEPKVASAWLELRESTLEQKLIPDFDLDARASGSTHAEFQLKAVDDSGLELKGQVDDSPDGLNFAVQGQAQRLPDYPSASMTAFDVRDLELACKGTWRSQTQSLDASLELDVERVAIPSADVAVADLSVHAATQGQLRAPALNGTISASALRVGELGVAKLQVQAEDRGKGETNVSARARVRLNKEAKVRELTARTTIAGLSPLHARSTVVSFEGDDQGVTASIGSVRVGDEIDVDDIRLSGAAQLTGHFGMKGNAVDTNAQIDSVDLEQVSQLFAPLVPPLRGVVNANVALKLAGQRLTAAHVFARAKGVGTKDLRAGDVGASLVVKRDALSGTVTVQRGESHVRIDARDVDLHRIRRATQQSGFQASDFRGYLVATIVARSGDVSEFERGQGELHVEGSLLSQLVLEQRDDLPLKFSSTVKLVDVDLRKAEPRVPTDWLDGTEEKLDEDASDKRDSAAESGQELAQSGSEWALTGLNAEWTSQYDGASGQWVNAVAASDRESPEKLARVAFSTTVPLSRLNENLPAWIPNAPVDGSLVVPLVTLDALPGGSFIPTGIDASIEANIRLSGTVSAPRAEGSLYVRDFQVSASNNSFPVTLAIDAKASKESVSANFRLDHDTMVLVSGNVEGTPVDNDWRAAAKLDKIPLGRLPYVRDYGVSGTLSGDVTFETGAGSPVIVATLEALDVEAYGEKMPTTRVDAKLGNGQGALTAKIKQTSGYAEITALATSPTGQLADYRPDNARLEADAFQVRPFMVALQGAVSDLSGVLDGRVDVKFRGGSTDATGELKLRDGLVLMPALGKQVHDIELTLRASPGQLDLRQLSAKVERGLVRGDGQLKYAPDGRMLAQIELRLPDDKRLPIANKGRDVAEASGRIKVAATSGPNEETRLSVDVPVLDVYFSDSATDKVMSSESPAFVSLGTYLPDGHFITYTSAREREKKEVSASQQTSKATVKPTLLTVNLGKKVWLHHGTSTFAGINGKVEMSLGDETRLNGMLNLAEGRIDIQGRVFDIRPGTVTFRGDSPPNPDVVAEAAWNAPSGYTVIAAYRGSVSNGKIVLRSEPPLSYGEILNVLLFDDPEGAGGSDGSPGAGEVAATIASAGLSKSLTSLTDMDIQANIETDAAGSPRPELGVRLTPRLAVEVAYNLEPSAALSQPPDKAFVSFDWRLSNSWTLEATLGDHGSAVTDVTWKYRY